MKYPVHIGVCLLAAACGCAPQPMASAPPSKKKVVPVRAVLAAETDVRKTSTQPASVHAFYDAGIQAMATGYVTHVLADIGQRVNAGDVLARIDVPELNSRREVFAAKIQSAKASQQSAAAAVELAKSRVAQAKAMRDEAQSSVASANAQLSASEIELGRVGDLVSRGSLQIQRQDESQARRDSDLAAQQAAQSAVTSADASVQVALAEVKSAMARLDSAAAETKVAASQLEELQVLIDYAEIRAPFDGVVTSRMVDVGDLVYESQGADSEMHSLFHVSQVDKLRIRIPVPESDAAHVSIGDSIELSFPSFANEKMTVQVSRLSGSLDASSRTMLVEADANNEQGKLLPGMFGQATILLATKIAACTLPARAVRFDEKGNAFVYQIQDDDTVSRVAITTGNDDGKTIEVLSGVSSGQKLVDAHIQRFADGDQVTIVQ